MGVALGVSLAATVLLPGCPSFGIVIRNVVLDNPSLSVGGSAHLNIDASSGTRTLHYTVQAARGRILPQGTTDQNVFTYYAPYTAKNPNSNGNLVSGDTITVVVNDGFSSQTQTLPVNLAGTTITYVQNADPNTGAGDIMLATTDDTGFQVTNQRQLKDSTGQPVRGAEPTVSPNGRMIAYVDYSQGSGNSTALVVIDAGGLKHTVVNAVDAINNLDPAWAPSSAEIAFASDRNGRNFNLYRISVGNEGATTIQITNAAINQRYPAWNPSLQQDRVSTMVVSAQMNDMTGIGSYNPTAAWNLFLLNIPQGAYVKQLTNLSDQRDYAFEAQWRGDGQVIAYTHYGAVQAPQADSSRYQRVYLQDVTQNLGSGQILNPTETSPSVFESSPVWNQIGTQIAYLKSFNPPTGPGTAQVWRQQINGLVPASAPPIQWTDFSAGIPAIWYQSTQHRPEYGVSFAWH
jgi:hypothetical protein